MHQNAPVVFLNVTLYLSKSESNQIGMCLEISAPNKDIKV